MYKFWPGLIIIGALIYDHKRGYKITPLKLLGYGTGIYLVNKIIEEKGKGAQFLAAEKSVKDKAIFGI